jgi:hypothetical protein
LAFELLFCIFVEDRRRKTPKNPGWDDLGGAGVYGASPELRDAWGRTAFLFGIILGREDISSSSLCCEGLGGHVVVGIEGAAENLEAIFENHDPLLCGDGLPLEAAVFSPDPFFPKLGDRDAGIGLAGVPFCVACAGDDEREPAGDVVFPFTLLGVVSSSG